MQKNYRSVVIAVLAERDAILDLGREWTELARRAHDYQFPQTFDWAKASIETNPMGRGELRCVIARRDGLLVGVWAFFFVREGLFTTAQQIGCGSNEEFGGPLIESGLEAEDIVEAMYDRVLGLADVVKVIGLFEDSLVDNAIRRRKHLRSQFAETAVEVPLRSFRSWEAYLGDVSKSLRSSIRYEMRRLAKLGELTFSRAEAAQDIEAVVDWILEAKQSWLEARQKGHWVTSSKPFWLALAHDQSDTGRLSLFTSRLNGTPIAGCICISDRSRMVFLVTTFDPAYAIHSPGRILIEGCLKQAFDDGLDFNFGLRPFGYKERWATERKRVFSYTIGSSRAGFIYVSYHYTRQVALWPIRAALKATPTKWKVRVKKILRRMQY